jgi:hypothetical protein
MMRGLTIEGVRLDLAAAVLDSLMDAGTIERALILGWDARELVGLQRAKPHDHQSRAGLVYSMRPGDAVSDIRDTGCAIAIAGSNVRHIWRRAHWTPQSACRGTYERGQPTAPCALQRGRHPPRKGARLSRHYCHA